MLVLPEIDDCPRHLVRRGVRVWIYQLGIAPACPRLEQGCRFLVHNYWLATQFGVNVPRELIDDGAPDADVLMFVTVRPIPSATLAFAGHCQEDEGGRAPYTPRRPTVGHVNIDPGSLYALEATRRRRALSKRAAAHAKGG